jgi:hypothetical protein
MTIDSTGNVGIGTDAPDALLDVNSGGVTSYATPSLNLLSNHGGQAYQNNAGTQFYWNTSNGSGESEIVYGNLSTSYLSFLHNNAGTVTEHMRISSTGLVGIGTDDPNEFLHIEGAAPAIALGNTSGTTDWRMQNVDNSVRWVSNPRAGGAAAERMRIDASGNLLVGRTSTSAAATDYGTQLYSTGVIYQYSVVTGASDIHRWYNGSGTLVATINGDGEGNFAGGATYSGTLKADEIIQDGAPVVDSLQIIRAFMKLRAATADPDSTVEELREKLKTAVDDIIDQFQDQIDNMPTPETPSTLPAPERPKKKD